MLSSFVLLPCWPLPWPLIARGKTSLMFASVLFNLNQRIQSLRMLAGLGKFLQHPDDLQSVYAVAASVQGSPMAAQMMRHMLSQPGIAAMIQQQWRPAPIDLDALEQLPPGSLGHCLHPNSKQHHTPNVD